MTDKTITTPHHSEATFVETTTEKHSINIIERWVKAEKGEYAPLLFGNWEEGYTSMKLEGRYIDGKRI